MTAPRVEGEAHALLSHLEPLLTGRAVLVLGPPGALDASRAFLDGRGLPARCAPSEAGFPAASFDRVLLHAGGPLDAARVAGLGALLAPGGLLAVSIAADDAGTEALLREAFAVVQAASVVPLDAWAVAQDDARPGALTWDGSALREARPARRLLVCGATAGAPPGVTVAALPAGAGPAREASPPDLAAAAREALADSREAEAREDALLGSWSRG